MTSLTDGGELNVEPVDDFTPSSESGTEVTVQGPNTSIHVSDDAPDENRGMFADDRVEGPLSDAFHTGQRFKKNLR